MADLDILILHGCQVDVVEMTVLIADEHFTDFYDDPTNCHNSTKRLMALPIKALALTLLADRHQDMKIQYDSLIVRTCRDQFAENLN